MICNSLIGDGMKWHLLKLLDKLESAILELHSYDLPEIIVLPVEGGSKSYLEWITDSTKISDYPRG